MSALSFAAGAILPLLTVLLAPAGWLVPVVVAVSLAVLASLGAIGARTGGASMGRAALRVLFWGLLAMGITAGVGMLVSTVV